jgi:hypothetical protein
MLFATDFLTKPELSIFKTSKTSKTGFGSSMNTPSFFAHGKRGLSPSLANLRGCTLAHAPTFS